LTHEQICSHPKLNISKIEYIFKNWKKYQLKNNRD